MGRKKRKTDDDGPADAAVSGSVPPRPDPDHPPPHLVAPIEVMADPHKSPAVVESGDSDDNNKVHDQAAKKSTASSGYAMTTHSAEIIDEDIYVSDGSEDEDDDEESKNIEMLLVGSRMGIMRRGIQIPMLMQPNRQWVRDDPNNKAGNGEENEEAEQKRLQEQEEELAKLDPAQRAARLLAEKQRKLEEAKETARRVESEENAGRDPCLFSKRTAFDIRFDQIDDKPWTRGGDITDFFNYGLTEDDWLEYAQQQLSIRQELTDANRQRRPPDPTIVPVKPRTPSKQTPKVAVAVKMDSNVGEDGKVEEMSEDCPIMGPVLVKNDGSEPKEHEAESEGPEKPDEKFSDVHVGSGGAWGAGAAPGSMLAKLIEEQERMEQSESSNKDKVDEFVGDANMEENSHYGPSHDRDDESSRAWSHSDHRGRGDQDLMDEDESYRSGMPSREWMNHPQGGGPDNWNNQRGPYGQRVDHPNSFRGGGRGFYGGRAPPRGGRGYRDRPYHGGPPPRGGVGDFNQRKRSRDEYDSRGGSWRR